MLPSKFQFTFFLETDFDPTIIALLALIFTNQDRLNCRCYTQQGGTCSYSACFFRIQLETTIMKIWQTIFIKTWLSNIQLMAANRLNKVTDTPVLLI